MIYRAYCGGKKITNFYIGGKQTDEIWGGSTLLWKRSGKEKRVAAYNLETKIVTGNGVEIGFFTDYSTKKGTGYRKVLAACKPRSPYLEDLYEWGNETDGTTYVWANEYEGKVYVLQLTWYAPSSATTVTVTYDKIITISEDGVVENIATIGITKSYYKSRTVGSYTYSITTGAFYADIYGVHFSIGWETKINNGSYYHYKYLANSMLTFNPSSGTLLGTESVTGYSVDMTTNKGYRVSKTFEKNNGYVYIYYTYYPGRGVLLQNGVWSTDIVSGGIYVGSYNGNAYFIGSVLKTTTLYISADSVENTSTEIAKGANFTTANLSIYDDKIYGVGVKSSKGYEVRRADTSGATSIYKPTLKSSSGSISGIMMGSDTLFVFYSDSGYYMDIVPLSDL